MSTHRMHSGNIEIQLGISLRDDSVTLEKKRTKSILIPKMVVRNVEIIIDGRAYHSKM